MNSSLALTLLLTCAAPASAAVNLFLDVDGAPATYWLNYAVPATPAYTGNVPALLASLDAGLHHTRVIADDGTVSIGAPLAVNVLIGSGPANPLLGRDIVAVVGGDSTWTGQNIAGISWVGTFGMSFFPQSVYEFPVGTGGNATFDGNVILHELGHLIGGFDHDTAPGRYMDAGPYDTDLAWSVDEYAVLEARAGVVPEPVNVAVVAMVGGALILASRRRPA